MAWARVDDEGHVLEVTEDDPAGRYHPSIIWFTVPTGTQPGDTVSGNNVTRPPPPPLPPAGLYYVPLALLRERAMAAGQWQAVAAGLDALPADRRWMLLSLRAGLASDDADVRALLTQAGADADALMAMPDQP